MKMANQLPLKVYLPIKLLNSPHGVTPSFYGNTAMISPISAKAYKTWHFRLELIYMYIE